VKGWYRANQRSPVDIDSAGTKPLARKGNRARGRSDVEHNDALCADAYRVRHHLVAWICEV
jgi:hypothetical protein